MIEKMKRYEFARKYNKPLPPQDLFFNDGYDVNGEFITEEAYFYYKKGMRAACQKIEQESNTK